MDGWLDELAEALGVDPLSGGETGELLRASRVVAHGVERKFTPLASFLLGAATERSVAGGATREDAFRGSLERLRSLLPPPSEDEAGPAGEPSPT